MLQHGTIFTARDEQKNNAAHEEKQKLNDLMGSPQEPILTLSTVFPFDLFPDTVIIESTKVNIIIRDFFASAEIHSFPIKNIVDVSVETGPLFATLKILPRYVTQDQTTSVKRLWKGEALKARDIIQGLVLATRENIDVKKLPQGEGRKTLRRKLEQLGAAQSTY